MQDTALLCSGVGAKHKIYSRISTLVKSSMSMKGFYSFLHFYRGDSHYSSLRDLTKITDTATNKVLHATMSHHLFKKVMYILTATR